ncbi:MAG: hypothetical protein FWD87_06075 [Spirochaetaceae bacterium]|nr:hypothetical protein [Spirochaetaceae bacterium]
MKLMLIKIFLIFGIFFIYLQEVNAQDTFPQDMEIERANWLERSSSRDNAIIFDYFNAVGFEERIRAVHYIARRRDRNFSSLLDLMYYQRGDNVNEKEFILYLMLDNLFNDEQSFQESRESFIKICNNIANFRSSLLRKKIMEKTVLLDKREAENIFLNQAMFLLNLGQESRRFNREMLEESRIFFIYSQKVDSHVLNFYRHEIYITVSNIPYSFLDFQENVD